MKRSLWKLTALASVVAFGLIAAAQAQRGLLPAEPQDDPASLGDAPPWGVEDASRSPGAATQNQLPPDFGPSDPAVENTPFGQPDASLAAEWPDAGSDNATQPAGIDFRKFDLDSADTATASHASEDPSPIVLAQATSPNDSASGGFRPNVSEIGPFVPLDASGSATELPPASDSNETSPDPFFDNLSNGPNASSEPGGIKPFPSARESTAPEGPDATEPGRFDFQNENPGSIAAPADSEPGEEESLVLPAGSELPGSPIENGLPAGDVVPASHSVVGAAAVAAAGTPNPRFFGAQTSMVTIEKTAPPSVNVGETTGYEIVVRNTGSRAAEGVVVYDDVPRGARLLTTEPAADQQDRSLHWNLGALGPGEERRLGVQLVALDEGEMGSVARVAFSAAASAKTMVTRPQLALELVAPEEVLLGDELTLLVRLSNPGTGTATGVMLLNALPEGLEHPDGNELEYDAGTLPAGDTQEIPLMVKATRVGRVRTQVTATGEGNLKASAEAYVNVVAPELTLAQNGPQRRYLNRPATYVLTVANPGSAPATAVSVVDYVPETMEFLDASAGGGFDSGQGIVTWSLGDLGPGQTTSVEVTLMPRAPGEARNFARATAARDLQAESELMTLVEGVPAILLEVVDIDDPIEVGAETSYEIRVINQGSKATTNVRITAEVPPQFAILDATGPSEFHVEGNQILFDPVPRLGPRADTAYRVHLRGQAVGDVRFRVHLETDQLAGAVIEEESTRIYSDR